LSKVTQIRQRARTFLQKGKFDKAIEEYKRLTGMETKNPNYLNELGDIYLKAGDSVQAVTNFEKAVVNYEKVALYNNAVAVCKKILRIMPNRGDTIYKLGELRAKQKLGGEARAYFSKYLDHILANADTAGPELNGRINGILELVPENAQILDKAADALVMIGIKTGALEIYCRLRSDADRAGEKDQADAYQAKIDLLKKSMTDDEIELVENAMTSASGAQDAEPIVIPESPPDAGGSPEAGGSGEPPAAAAAAVPEADAVAADVVPPEADESVQPEEEEETAEEPRAAAEDEEDRGMADAPDGAGEPAGERTEARAPAGGGEQEDLSSLLDDVRNADTAESLVEEITSDVEEDDFRSHYDLGMAYLEMALYTEAIKEFQIASRSDQLKIKSIEMIGHCFLMQNNPRLAVKQLLRGLELVKVANSESLGVHYNLGLAYEMLGDTEKAREHYEEVYIVDISFRDIAGKMKKLSTVS